MLSGSNLSWAQRVKIALSAAEGIEFLHQAEPSVVHSDIKSSNILLFDNDVAKIGDLRVTKNRPGFLDDILLDCACVHRHRSYDAPECEVSRKFTRASDVFSFGVVLLELLTGIDAIYGLQGYGQQSYMTWAQRLGKYPMLEGQYNSKAAAKMAEIASRCQASEANSRPSMSVVVNGLRSILQNKQESGA